MAIFFSAFLMLLSFPIRADVLEFNFGLASGVGETKGVENLPAGVTYSEEPKKLSGTFDARVMLYPFSNRFVGLGYQFVTTVLPEQSITVTTPGLTGYNKAMPVCTAAEGLLALSLYNPGGKDMNHRLALIGGPATKANCVFEYKGTGLKERKNTAEAEGFSGALSFTAIFNELWEIGFEGGYRSLKSKTLKDPDGNELMDSDGNPVKMDMSSPFITIRLGMFF